MDDEFPAITKARSLALKRHRRLGELKQRLNGRPPGRSNADDATGCSHLNDYPKQSWKANEKPTTSKDSATVSCPLNDRDVLPGAANAASLYTVDSSFNSARDINLTTIAARAETILADARAKVDNILGSDVSSRIGSRHLSIVNQDVTLARARALLKQHKDTWVPYEKAAPFGQQRDLALQQKSPHPAMEQAHSFTPPACAQSNQSLGTKHYSSRSVVPTVRSHVSPGHSISADAHLSHTIAQPAAENSEAGASSHVPFNEELGAVSDEVCFDNSTACAQSHDDVVHPLFFYYQNEHGSISIPAHHESSEDHCDRPKFSETTVESPATPCHTDAVAVDRDSDPGLRPGCLRLDEGTLQDNERRTGRYEHFHQPHQCSPGNPTSLNPCSRSTCSEAWSVTTAGSDDIRASRDIRDTNIDGGWGSSADKKAASAMTIDNPYLLAHLDTSPPRTQDTTIDQEGIEPFWSATPRDGSTNGTTGVGAEDVAIPAESHTGAYDFVNVVAPPLSAIDGDCPAKEKRSARERAELGWSVARLSVAFPLEAKPPSRLRGLSQRVRMAMDAQARKDHKPEAHEHIQIHRASSLSIDSHEGLGGPVNAAEVEEISRKAALRRMLRRWACLAANRNRRARSWCDRYTFARRLGASASTAVSAWVDKNTVATRAGRHGLAVLHSNRKLQRFIWSKWVTFMALTFGFVDGLGPRLALQIEEAAQYPETRKNHKDKDKSTSHSESDDEVVLLMAPKG